MLPLRLVFNTNIQEEVMNKVNEGLTSLIAEYC